MKNKIKNILLVMIVAVISGSLSSFLTTNSLSGNKILGSVSHSDYLDSSNVTYLDSNVQDSIDSLYTQANDYSSINTRVNTLEGYVHHGSSSNSDWLIVGKDTAYTYQKGILIYDTDIVRGSLYYDPSKDKTEVASYNSLGQIGEGTLNLNGNSVTVNGTNISNVQTKSYTYKGLNIKFYKIGHNVQFLISGVLTDSLTVSGTYETILTGIDEIFRPVDNQVIYVVYGSTYIGQIYLAKNGDVKLGHVIKIYDGTASNIASGKGIYTFTSYISSK